MKKDNIPVILILGAVFLLSRRQSESNTPDISGMDRRITALEDRPQYPGSSGSTTTEQYTFTDNDTWEI